MPWENVFKDLIKSFAEFMQWDITDAITDDYAGFSFDLGEDNQVDLDFFLNDDRVDIALVGQAYAETETDIPDEFSTLLLRRSDDLTYGGWALAETDEAKYAYRLLWTVDLDYLMSIKHDRLQEIIENLMDEVSDVNTIWEEGEF
jgi:hypothetical protein